MVLEGPLTGRESELLALEQAVGSARVVTVTGAGGCGQTRVRRELAARIGLRAKPLDVVIVELAMIRSSDHVVDAVLRALRRKGACGANADGGHRRGSGWPLQRVGNGQLRARG